MTHNPGCLFDYFAPVDGPAADLSALTGSRELRQTAASPDAACDFNGMY